MTPRRIVIRDDTSHGWWSLSDLREQRAASTAAECLATVAWAEQQALAGRWVCGYLRFEAAAAMDAALRVKRDVSDLPLAWFAAFDTATEAADPALAATWPQPAPSFAAELSREQYQQKFDRVKDYLGAGDSYQVNLTFGLHADFDGDCYDLFCQLCANQAGRYAAFMDFGDWVLMSASPELFFERHGSLISTRPMKGTTRRGNDEHEDRQLADALRADPKNQAENLMIVDMLRNDLGRVAEVGSVEVPKLFEVESYPRIQQMTTTVTARSDKSLPELMQGLFPCASITGAPKPRTMQIIAEVEQSPRELYTGSVGLLRPGGDCQFSVVIRSATWRALDRRLSFAVGSGVVWDSDGDEEYAECLLKANIFAPQAPLALFETIHWNSDTGYRLLDGHRARLQRSAAALGIRFDPDAFDRLMANEPPDALARVRVHLANDGELSRLVAPAPAPMASMSVAFCPWPVSSDWPLLRHKVDRRDVYQRAFADTPSCDQPLLWNEQGMVTEGVFSNVVIREGHRLITPPISDGVLPGVMRAHLLEQGELEEQSISRERLLAADELWLINSLRGWIRAVVPAG